MSRRRRVRRNPEGGVSLVKVGLGVGAAYLAWRWLSGSSKAGVQEMPKGPPTPQDMMPSAPIRPASMPGVAEINGEPVASTMETPGLKGLADSGLFAGTLFGR